jgi:pimeloyl-ACP methyl ester carboxylesterase
MKQIISAAFSSVIAFSGVACADYVELENGVTIHYEVAGRGNMAIVFTPGWMMSTEVFEHQLAYFENSETVRAIAYDPRGQGKSSKTIEGHTYQQHARDLNLFIEALELDSVILAGWSYGVTEQLAYIDQFGADRVEAMVLIDTGPDVSGESREEWVWYLNDDSDGYSRWFTEGIIEDRQSVITEFSKWMLEDASEENVTWLTDIANLTSSSAASIQNATAFYLDYSDDLIALAEDTPLLYVVREESQQPAEAWIAANTPNAHRAYFGKHLMFWERPEEFNAVLNDFLAKVMP